MRLSTVLLALAVIGTGLLAWWPQGATQTSAASLDRYLGVELEFDPESIDMRAVGDNAAEALSSVTAEVITLVDQVARIEVGEWDGISDRPRSISVARGPDGWQVTSRFDYPADADDVIGEVAGGVLGVKRDHVVATSAERHPEFGLIDPQSPDAILYQPDEIGRRIRLSDAGGAVLVDLLVGRRAGDGLVYVREGDAIEVVAARVGDGFRARFIDWVRPDPFHLDPDAANSLVVYEGQSQLVLDQRTGQAGVQWNQEDGAALRKGDDGQWLADQPRAGLTIDQEQVTDIVGRLRDLRLVDVRQSEEGLMAFGFYPTGDGQVFGRAGAFHLTTATGFIYEFIFGELAASQTDENTAAADQSVRNDRYLMVRAAYVPEQDSQRPTRSSLAIERDIEGDDVALLEAINDHELLAARQKHAEARREVIADLVTRNQAFVYVIRDSDYQVIKPDPGALFVAPEAPDAEEAYQPSTTPAYLQP